MWLWILRCDSFKDWENFVQGMCLRKEEKKENFTSLQRLGVLKKKKLITAQRKYFINKVSHFEALEEWGDDDE